MIRLMKETQPDFYLNKNGLKVMTEAFLKRRGFCCHSGCKHCPYGEEESDPNIPHELKNSKSPEGPFDDKDIPEEFR